MADGYRFISPARCSGNSPDGSGILLQEEPEVMLRTKAAKDTADSGKWLLISTWRLAQNEVKKLKL